jgi:tRNA modification GTPase
VAALAERTVVLRMLVEATLDFPEEEIDFLEKAGARAKLDGLLQTLDTALARARQGALLREGLRVVLAGQPNVGKSSLLNALAGAELAIVTPIPGTTRDKVSETVQIEGVPLHISDTAGLRSGSTDEVERIGIERSWQAIADADAVLFLHDLSRADDAQAQIDDAAIAADLARAHAAAPLHVFTKRDLAPHHALPDGALALSAQTGAGLDALRDALLERAGATHVPDGVFIARTRHVDALTRTDAHLQAAQAHADQRDAALDLFAEELRLAHGALGEITGQFTADDLLGEIFGRFCIGK